jgi:hypothetical protein
MLDWLAGLQYHAAFPTRITVYLQRSDDACPNIPGEPDYVALGWYH